jgi:RNase adaptor protein for sRNA GlmZ degradation
VPRVLQYDIHSLPNPPKNIRTQQTGLDKSLREWFFSRLESVAKLDEVCATIDAALDEVAKSGVGCSEIHVVVFCEMGKHRSVALVEELSRRAFFVGTEDGRKKCPVVVQYRDVARGKHDARRKRNPADSSQE